MTDARAQLDATLSEAALQAAIVRAARLLGYAVYHPWSSVHSERGWPDLVMVRERPDGTVRIIVAELKRSDGVLSREQQEWLDLLGRCPGIEAYIWRPAEWSAGLIEQVLREDGSRAVRPPDPDEPNPRLLVTLEPSKPKRRKREG